MMKIRIILLLFEVGLSIPMISQTIQEDSIEPRTISSFREYRSKIGTNHTIGDLILSEPDIYYTDNNNGTYNAIRLTVQPIETPAEVTAPYLNQATANSIQVCWKTKNINEGSIVYYGTSPN